MTHFHATKTPRAVLRAAFYASLGMICFSLAGCTSTSNLAFPDFWKTASAPQQADTAQAATAKPIALAQVIGAPPAVAKELTDAVEKAATEQKLTIAKGQGALPEYTLRGYLVAAPDAKGTKLSYIWDITNKSGIRAHRIQGEEIIAGAPLKKGTDPWSQVNPATLQAIANKTTSDIAQWLPTQKTMVAQATPNTTPAPATQTVATAQKKPLQAAPTKIASKPLPKAAPAKNNAQIAAKKTVAPAKPKPVVIAQKPPAAPAAKVQLAALKSNTVTALVPTVVGAPGDGQNSLTAAIKKQLNNNGVKVANAATSTAYKVEGAVSLSAPKQDGKQDIAIEWKVMDPSGKKLGTVSQRNSIPKGSLDGAWGKTADAAAAAAAEGILKLLPKTK